MQIWIQHNHRKWADIKSGLISFTLALRHTIQGMENLFDCSWVSPVPRFSLSLCFSFFFWICLCLHLLFSWLQLCLDFSFIIKACFFFVLSPKLVFCFWVYFCKLNKFRFICLLLLFFYYFFLCLCVGCSVLHLCFYFMVSFQKNKTKDIYIPHGHTIMML